MSAGEVILAVIAPLLALVAAIFTALLARQGQRETRVVQDLRADVAILKAERDEALVRERIRDDYIHKLRDHITRGRGAPPPPWPEGLTT